MHKWNSNISQLESEIVGVEEQPTFAKQQLVVKEGEPKLLGLPWNKSDDSIAVTFPEKPVDVTRRGILRFLAAVYDSLGLASPATLVGKFLYVKYVTCVCHGMRRYQTKLGKNGSSL